MAQRVRKPVDYAREILKGARRVEEVSDSLKKMKEDIINENLALRNEISVLQTQNRELIDLLTEYNLGYLHLLNNRTNKKQLLIMGYYGAPNFGDEVMLQILLRKLNNYEKIREEFEITVMVANNLKDKSFDYPDVKLIGYPKSFSDINFLAYTYDLMIIGGGCLIDDADYNYYDKELSLGYTIINLTLQMESFGKEVVWYGLSSTWQLKNAEYIEKLKKAIGGANYVSLRDTNSLQTLAKYGVDVSNIKIVDDLALAEIEMNSERNKNKPNSIGLIYMMNNDNYESLKKFTVKILGWTAEQKTELVLIPFCERDNMDSKFYTKLKNELKDERVKVERMPRDIKDFLEIICEMDIVISMRYHGTLLANFAGCEVINLKNDLHSHYKNKIDYLYEFYNFKNKEILISEINDLDEIRWIRLTSKKRDNDCNDNKKLEEVRRRTNDEVDTMINEVILSDG